MSTQFQNTPEQARKLWVEALRSGRYEQGEGFLCMPLDVDGESFEFCCLGIACEMFCLHEHPLPKGAGTDGETQYDNHSGDLPIDVRLWLGMSTSEGDYCQAALALGDEPTDSLVNDNDSDGKSFGDIAAIIESAPPGLFVEAANA